MKLKIKRLSTAIYEINGYRVDVRKHWHPKKLVKFEGIRQALMLYFYRNGLNKGVTWPAMDSRVVTICNRWTWTERNALEQGELIGTVK